MKKLYIIILCSLVLLLSSCEITIKNNTINSTKSTNKGATTMHTTYTTINNNSTIKEINNEKEIYNELLKDPYYRDGFRVYYPDEGNAKTYSNKLLTLNESTTASWELAQWSSKYDIMNSKKGSGFGEYSFINNETNPPSKKLIVNTNTGSLRIVLNAESEYTRDRKSGESWPHLLLQQNFDDNLINISSMKEIYMNIDFVVNSCENKTISKYDDSLHCAQFVWYITLQNRNQESKDYGKYVWFGLNLFDSRLAGTVTSEYGSVDGGKENNTGCFIFQSSSEMFMSDGKMTTVGKNTSISYNIMEAAKKAYNLAIERGYLGSTKFEELYIGSTNFGFEVPGTFNIDVTISKVQIEYK